MCKKNFWCGFGITGRKKLFCRKLANTHSTKELKASFGVHQKPANFLPPCNEDGWRQYEQEHGIGEQNDALIIVNQQNLGLNLLAWRSNHWHKPCERKWTLCAHIGKSFTSANNGNFKNLCNFRSWDKIGFSILTELWYRARAGQAWGGEEEEKLRKVMILFSSTDKQERHTSWMKFFWMWKDFLCVSKAKRSSCTAAIFNHLKL